VLSVEPVQRRVVVGALDDLDVHRLTGERAIWCGPPPRSGQPVMVQVRAHGEPVPGRLVTLDDEVVAQLDEPVRGAAPGQAMVLYDGDRVIGSATIRREDT
jgi:tRNA-specific 2-thiouridylase